MGEDDDIPQEFYDKLRRRVLAKIPNKSTNILGCWLWGGAYKKNSHYGIEYISIRGDRMCVGAHRAAYIAFNRKFCLPYDISHCCHNPACVNPAHLEHEMHCINMERERCREVVFCRGHQMEGKNLKSCLFANNMEE